MTQVLIVAEDSGLLRMLTLAFRTSDYEAQATRTVEEALSTARLVHPDVIVVDSSGAGAPLEVLLGTLRRAAPGVPIIVSHTDATPDSAVGASLILRKPFRTDVLLEAVNVLVAPGT
jgi:DNA-binding response OmpR family regulator